MILDDIIARTASNLKAQKERVSFSQLERALELAPAPRDVRAALTREKINIIAEVKKASPSKGLIRADFDPLAIALEYEDAGAAAISVLTEPDFFMGNLEYLGLIKRFSRLPLLRKDFVIEPYQIAQARVWGADFILLIAKALGGEKLRELLNYARSLGLVALVEIHDAGELEIALDAGAEIVGINHRNLNDFSMHMDLCAQLLPRIPKDKIIVAESGLHSHEQLESLAKEGVSAFLIGEHFMRQKSAGAALKSIKGEA